ncbi:hypothetical protein ACIQFZ_22090 [Streptomyces sp. NPDC093064]|uniref:hypothetical protein n=1 Tax=Streptomyces sp. NPDC093064 TaxID=3366020 RepID=UPI00381123E9
MTVDGNTYRATLDGGAADVKLPAFHHDAGTHAVTVNSGDAKVLAGTADAQGPGVCPAHPDLIG